MNKVVKKISWWIFALLAICIGLYPIMYFAVDRHFGLLRSKSPELLNDLIWNAGFYGHIIFGGLALLSGWSQFSKNLRRKRLNLHRVLGKFYVITVMISGICGIYIGYHATGGWITKIGFMSLGIIWVTTTFGAFQAIRRQMVERHENLMILSYAACFAAVTLRIWLPMLTSITGDFIPAYRIVAWLCWVPNIVVALAIINYKRKHSAPAI